MDEVRVDGEAQADEVFTPERLWNQHQAILHRLEQVGRPARVLSFPDRIEPPRGRRDHRVSRPDGSPRLPPQACSSASRSAACSSTMARVSSRLRR